MKQALTALRAFIVKEFQHILRDRQTLIILLGLPVAQLTLFGFALRTDVRDIRLAYMTEAPDDATAALRTRFARNGRFTMVDLAPTPGALDAAFRADRADVALVIAPGLADRLRDGRDRKSVV